ncbi:Chaperone protein DnaK [Orchesella cincta]|uniref:Chaperone protein DnaK n=1 Tax=Orchesella cincta TaxID=48709 RepID=A0A1D2N118_ORCCI|nr:Chaperone protein DnaK [Orchesella cincta]
MWFQYILHISLVLGTASVYAESSTTCGGVLTGETGGISYKAFEPHDQNERCVWILRTDYAERYEIVLINRGMASSNDKVIVTSLGLRSPDIHTVLTRIDTLYNINGSVAIITFFSDSYASSASTGFTLYYNAVFNEQNPEDDLSPWSVEHLVTQNSAEIRHPLSGGVYTNNELSTFVFSPNSVYSATQNLNVNVTILGFEPRCADTITVYFLTTTNSAWRNMGRICGFESKVTLINPDLILLIFRTDEANVAQGFHLSFSYW